MREAMAHASLGDDVYGEDPTVNALESMAAEKVGKEAALFVASGTMGNLVGILSHAERGDEAIVGEDAHTYLSEAGNMSSLGGVVPRILPTDGQGRMGLAAIESAVRMDDPHYPRSRVIALENSYARKQGYPIAPDYFADVRRIADRHDLRIHLDGARLFNAVVALGVDAREITQHVDSVSFCLSKALCAPVGSLLCGSAELIHRARRVRKSVGGGMRQAGVLAAAGIVALEQMVDRLANDHACARSLADGLAAIPGIIVSPETVKTNMVFFGLDESVPLSLQDVITDLRHRANVWLGTVAGSRFRAVTHYWTGPAEVQTLLDALRETLNGA